MNEGIRVRFAPSPTGLLHIGGLRTALFNYLFARQHRGTFVLRIEDTDRKRFVEEAEQDILQSLSWTGLQWDEGPSEHGSPEGEHGPYHQSEKKARYVQVARSLVQAGHAYYAFDTEEEIELMRHRLQTAENPVPRYDAGTRMKMRNSLTLSDEEVQRLVQNGFRHVIRMKIDSDESIQFEDEIRGEVVFESGELDDQVLIKADGMPTYHLANVVDDHDMSITHVIRGEEWLSSAPKHLLLYRHLGWKPPKMAHLPLIMSPGGGKLSKRKAEKEGIPVNVRDYRRGGYEPEALVNFLALMGWSPGDDRELLTIEEMINEFSLERVGKSGAIFDYNKLLWFNAQRMRKRSDEDLSARLRWFIADWGLAESTDRLSGEPSATRHDPFPVREGQQGWDSLTEYQKSLVENPVFLSGVVRLLKERVSCLSDFLIDGRFFFFAPVDYDQKAIKKGWVSGTGDLLSVFRDRITQLDESVFKAEELKQILTGIIQEKGIGMGKLMLPLRIAITGSASGPDLFEMLELLGRKEVVQRLDFAMKRLG